MVHCRVIETQVVSPRWHRTYGLIRRKNRRDTCARCYTAPLTSSYAVYIQAYTLHYGHTQHELVSHGAFR